MSIVTVYDLDPDCECHPKLRFWQAVTIVVTALRNAVTCGLVWLQQPDHKQEINFKTSLPSVHHLLFLSIIAFSKNKNKNEKKTYHEASYVSCRKACFLFNKITCV